jgi:hypothetical protein
MAWLLGGDGAVDDQLWWHSAETCTRGKLNGEQRQWPVRSNPSNGAANLPMRMTATGWRGDVGTAAPITARDAGHQGDVWH